MSDYDDDDSDSYAEDEPERAAIHVRVTVTKRLDSDGQILHEAVSEHEIVDAALVNAAVMSAIKQHVGQIVENARYGVLATFAEQAGAIIDREVEAYVTKVLRDGWTIHDRWGGATKVVSAAQVVEEALTPKPGDGYNRGTPSALQRAIDSQIEKLLTHQFKDELTKATAQFRAKVDELMSAKIADGLRSAFGLR